MPRFHHCDHTNSLPLHDSLLSKQPPHPLQHTILLRIVRVVLTWDLEQGGKRCGVALHTVSYLLSDVLVDEQNRNILALGSELVECSLDDRVFGFRVHDEEVLLAVRGLRDVLERSIRTCWAPKSAGRESYAYACEEHACDGVL
jgi:hypothetical protein